MELVDLQAFEHVDIYVKSSDTWYTTDILQIGDKTVTVKLPKDLRNFFVTDEVKCRVTDGKNTYLFDGEVFDIIFKYPQALVLFIPGQIKKYDKFRKEKRFNVGILAQIYKLKAFYGYVKDLSIKGICLHSKGFLDKGDEIGVTLYFDDGKQCVYFEGRVVRKIEFEDYKEYGIEIDIIKSEELDKYIKYIEQLENTVHKAN